MPTGLFVVLAVVLVVLAGVFAAAETAILRTSGALSWLRGVLALFD